MGPLVVLLTGLPGSGKSYYARSYSEKLGAIVISSERIRAVLLGVQIEERDIDFTAKEESQVYELMHYFFVEALSASKSIVLDGVFRSNQWRAKFETTARERGARFVGVNLGCSREIAYRRMKDRKARGTTSPAGPEAYEDIRKVFASPPDDYVRLINEGGPVQFPRVLDDFLEEST